MSLHPIQRRLLAEQLVRRRRADEHERYAASQRRGRIDANPHQIDAVIFALRRIPDGGCILADEVGLGKTIEAGLIISQLLAEGAQRILIIAPKSLLGQWQNELYTLFGIEASEGARDELGFLGPGVFLVGREYAGGERGYEALRYADPFDLCIIDEAHEIFAGIHKRYDRHGEYQEDDEKGVARMAHRVKQLVANTPILLLTATPIQNSLTELWGLVQYVEPTGTLLGNLSTFRDIFCAGDDRRLVPEQAAELRNRISNVLQRTLRRQAQDFLTRPFVSRRAQLFEYEMSTQERSLYEDVTRYLLEPDLCAFRGRHRRLLLIGFHRRMASSLPALAASLRRVSQRLEQMLESSSSTDDSETVADFARDLEDDDLTPERDEPDVTVSIPDPAVIRAELARVTEFAARAESLPADGKAEALLRAMKLIRERHDTGTGSGKVVIFTESLATQDYIQALLMGAGMPSDDITLFRGQNDSARAREALTRWKEEVEPSIPSYNRPSPTVATRLALVHEFRTRSRVFVATEAGAKGLNLQFCENLINYDLPWNPQRIEQRIGRCHRYGQDRDVTVINFIASDNDAQRLTFEILSQKLDLFGEVLDASDAILYEADTATSESLVSAVGVDFEKRLNEIYDGARTIDDITADLQALRDEMDEQRRLFEETLERTHSLIETRLDEGVRTVFRRIKDELPASLAKLDSDIDALVSGYLDELGVSYRRETRDGRVFFDVGPSSVLPEGLANGGVLVVGHVVDLQDADPLHLGHPLLQAAVENARDATAGARAVRVLVNGSAPPELSALRGCSGRLVVSSVRYGGFEPVDHLLATALLEESTNALDAELTLAILDQQLLDAAPSDGRAVVDERMDDAVDEAEFVDQTSTAREEEERFRHMLDQIERFVDDRLLVLRRRRTVLEEQLRAAQQRWEGATGPTTRADAEKRLRLLQSKLDDLDRDITQLNERRDEEYQKWRSVALERRSASPESTRILDVEFSLE